MSWQPGGWQPGGWQPGGWQPGGGTAPPPAPRQPFNLPPIAFGGTTQPNLYETPVEEPAPYIPPPPTDGGIDPRNYGAPGPAIPGNFPSPGLPSLGNFRSGMGTARNQVRGLAARFPITARLIGGLLGAATGGPVGAFLGYRGAGNLIGNAPAEIEMPRTSSDYFAELYGTADPTAPSFHSQRSGTRFVQGQIDPSGLPIDRSAHSYMPPVFAGQRQSALGNVTYEETM